MTLAERLKAEGTLEGKLESAEGLLAENVELAFIERITGFSLAKLKELQKTH